jgi:hypothetical protein
MTATDQISALVAFSVPFAGAGLIALTIGDALLRKDRRRRARYRTMVESLGYGGRASPILGNERLPNRCRCPSVRAVNRWNLLRVQLVGDRFKGHPLTEHCIDLHPPPVVTFVAEPMRKSDVVGCEVPSVHLESRIVVGRRLPIGTRRSRLEVPTTPEAVALRHLATHVDDLAISGKLQEDSANLQGLELLKCSLSIHEAQTRARTCQNLLLALRATAGSSVQRRRVCRE